jgi:hypothetical protein
MISEHIISHHIDLRHEELDEIIGDENGRVEAVKKPKEIIECNL